MSVQRAITVEELRALKATGVKLGMPSRRGKYGAIQVVSDGVRYHSKSEFAFKMYLDLLVANGIVAWYTRQVPFYLPGGKRYVCDFLVVMKGTPPPPQPMANTRVIDVKGKDTPNSATKRSVIQSTHGIVIEVVDARSDGKYTWR